MSLNKLRELAQAATPGPWTLEYDSDSGEYGQNYGRWPYALNGPKSTHQWITPEFIEQHSHHVTEFADMTDEDAEFIAAANPATVLALLDKIALLQELLAAAEHNAYAWTKDEETQ